MVVQPVNAGVNGPPNPVREFRNEGGEYDAKAIAETLGISLGTAARILGVSTSTASRNPDSAKIRKRAAKLERLFAELMELYDDPDYVRAWLKTPSSFWAREGEISPLELMAEKDWGLERVSGVVNKMRRGDFFT